ncbi:MAG TPA: tRNA epoxyqueuosine(34) reductase QueG [Myxococcota bacterium]|nr:tRNA epoxyqueuosine(34) reductase QueG [Myxococcota bacterium]
MNDGEALPLTLTERAKALALALGFDLAGVTPALPRPETEFLRDWLARGFAGEMDYIGRRVEERVDPRRVLDGARSILAVALVYDPGIPESAPPRSARIARYAGGDDYHDVMLDRLRALESGLTALAGGPVATRAYVDTGPVQERVFAAYAGLGWIGKNTCLIHPRYGSYLFLGVLITDLALDADERGSDHCGSCRACLDACPTGAIVAPYELDATRCISYATIEARGPIPERMRVDHADWVFGCDVCQEVCPWNRRGRRQIPPDPLGLRARVAPRAHWIRPSLAWILALDEESWRRATRNTALRRARFRGLIRNALIAAGNARDPELAGSISRHLESADPLLAEHARWALAQLPR